MTAKDCKILDIVTSVEQIKKHNMLCDFVDENIGPSEEYADVSLSNINDAGKQVIQDEASKLAIFNNKLNIDLSNITHEGIKNVVGFEGIDFSKIEQLAEGGSNNLLSPVIAPSDGWILSFINNVKGQYWAYYINNSKIVEGGLNTGNPQINTIFNIRVSKGDVFQIKPIGSAVTYYGRINFAPLKGVFK